LRKLPLTIITRTHILTILIKCKKVCNPKKNVWDGSNTKATISNDGLNARNEYDTIGNRRIVFAEKAFAISGENCRIGQFPGNIIYYFEVTQKAYWSVIFPLYSFLGFYSIFSQFRPFLIGLSDGNIPDSVYLGWTPNSYGMRDDFKCCWLSNKEHAFEWPNGVKPKWTCLGAVVGCGLVLNTKNELAIFFTGNGFLLGKFIIS
jgi:hypothetical protein